MTLTASTIPLSALCNEHPVRIANPSPGGSAYTSAARARRFVLKGRAHLDSAGRLVFDRALEEKGLERDQPIMIVNPIGGGSQYTSRKRAEHLVTKGRAYFDAAGRLVFYGEHHGEPRETLCVERFSGQDAFPGRAVLPPSGEVLARLNTPSRRYIPAAVVMRLKAARNRAAQAPAIEGGVRV